MTDKKFTCAGITTHSRADVTVTKVRYGNDYVRLIKQLSSNKKIGVNHNVGDREDGFLDAIRVDLIELPNSMIKIDALKFLAAHPDFQSAADQATIHDEITDRSPRVKKVKTTSSIDSIKSRMKSAATVEQVLAAFQSSTITE